MDELGSHYDFVGALSEAGGRLLDEQVRWREVPARSPLIAKGDRIGGVYFVGQGALRVFHINVAGRENTLYWVEPGDSCILAMNCVFGEMQYPAWVSAECDTRIAMIPAPVYRQLFERERAVQRFTFDVLSGRIFELMSMLTEAISFGVEQRLAALLLRKADDLGTVAMSQEVMANHLGTAREVVSRAIRSLAAQDLLRSRRGAVDILDATALAALIDES